MPRHQQQQDEFSEVEYTITRIQRHWARYRLAPNRLTQMLFFARTAYELYDYMHRKAELQEGGTENGSNRNEF